MTDLRFSAESPMVSQQQKFPLTPQPVYPKFKPSDFVNNFTNKSTEQSKIEESRILCTKNQSYLENENSAELHNWAKQNPLTLKNSSFSLCKNFLFSKNFEEMKINEIGIFSSLRIKTKNPNLANFTLNSNCNQADSNKKEDQNEPENVENNGNQDNIGSNFANEKRSSLFAASLKKIENVENKNTNTNTNDEIFNNLNALNNFSLNQINNKIENSKVKSNHQLSNNNNNFNNNDKNEIELDNKNFQNFGSRIFPCLTVGNFENNFNYYNAPLDFSNGQTAELKLLKHKNLSYGGNDTSCKSDYESKNGKNNLFHKKILGDSYEEINNFKGDSQTLNKPSCFRKFSNNANNRENQTISNFGSTSYSGLNKNHPKENEKEKCFNINNITNIYINFENGNHQFHSNFKAVNPIHHNLFNKESSNLSYLPYINNHNNSNTLFPNKLGNHFISKSLNSSPLLNHFSYLNQNNIDTNNRNQLENISDRFVCSNTDIPRIPISDKFQKERIFRKIFNLCELSICRQRVKRLRNNLFDIYNIELVEPLYKNNFKSLTVEKRSRNAKLSSLDANDFLNNLQTEDSVLHEIQLKINALFNEILDIQKKYLTKASGYISKKQVLNCENFINQINQLSENLIKINPQAYKFSEDPGMESDYYSDAGDENFTSNHQRNKKSSKFRLSENEDNLIMSNNCSCILNNNQCNFKDENSFNCGKLNSKRNKIIINNAESIDNFLGSSNLGENDNFSSTLELNDLNQMDITNNYSDFKPEKHRKNSAFAARNDKILQRKISKAASETSSTKNRNLLIKPQKENYSEKSFNSDLDKECFSTLENSGVSKTNSKSSSKAAKTKSASKSAKFSSNRKSSKNESSSDYNENKEIYKCDHCDSFYYTGQALGGHMSRTHPNLSLKYKMKKIVRDRRENQRNVLTDARRELLIKYNLDYEDMKNDKIKKHILKSFIKEHSLEYKEIVKKFKKMKKIHK